MDELNEKEADMKSKYEKIITNMKEAHKILLFTSIVIKKLKNNIRIAAEGIKNLKNLKKKT